MNIENLFKKDRIGFSLEIFPPKKTGAIDGLYTTLEGLYKIHPDFISVTYGAGSGEASNKTAELASYIKNSLKIEPLAHLTCVNSTEEKLKQDIAKLYSKGVENILALRGDLDKDKQVSEQFSHSSDLAKFIKNTNSNINVVGACYPEGHYEAKNIDEDIDNLKYKLDNGVSHLITQLFFDNEKFYRFIDKVRNNGINVPIEAGIMPIVTTKQIERTVALSGASLPHEFTRIINRYSNNKEALFHAGIAYSIEQIYELIEHGVDGIHLYTMNNATVATQVYNGIKTSLGRD